MRTGKLTADELQRIILDKLKCSRGEVVLSAAQGEDCAAVAVDGYTLYSSDPITAALPADRLGALVVDVCCNDLFACGGEPIALMLTVIVPPTSDTNEIERIMAAASRRAEQLKVDIIGGHTEFSDCVTRPIVSGTAIGKALRLLTKSALKVGDKLYVTKSLGIEGTTIIADGGEELTDEEKAICSEYRSELGVENEGAILRSFDSVGVMHDITEGGIIGAVAEICLGRSLGALIYEKSLPVSGLTKRLCDKYGIDVARLISSGSMLFSASSDEAAEALKKAGIAVAEIGDVTDGEVIFVKKDGSKVSVKPERDAIYDYFERCCK